MHLTTHKLTPDTKKIYCMSAHIDCFDRKVTHPIPNRIGLWKFVFSLLGRNTSTSHFHSSILNLSMVWILRIDKLRKTRSQIAKRNCDDHLSAINTWWFLYLIFPAGFLLINCIFLWLSFKTVKVISKMYFWCGFELHFNDIFRSRNKTTKIPRT